ncbi:type III effector [Sediminicola sp. YIK13]|uniref:HopJ type III effector protein n=1 Tax=Sediminicola sp. YIK13 TaxID=1453352 RepID=UPI0007211AC9|nr:HopJ type III effector protein [Sediminicola sp. YIK13]ALM08484.1 type III effector [Sediminicola sp. YIK13]
MTVSAFVEKLRNDPQEISFKETIAVIEDHYLFEPVRFTNGRLVNEAGQNSGSCKLLFFAKLHNLNKAEALVCFGDYYRQDVLKNLNGENHQNIRNFMQTGWEGISFDNNALIKK